MNAQQGNHYYSINPFLPCYEYIPDGEPRVFGDRVYVYGSHDLLESKSYCKGDYVCWSAQCDDLVHWKFEGVIYKREQDPFVKQKLDTKKGNMMNSHLFAPDIIEIDGKYYLYYGVGLSNSGIGVAVSESPSGPFEYLGRVRYPETEKPKGWKDGKDGIKDGDLAFGYGKSVLTSVGHYPYDPGVIYDNGHLFLYYGLAYCRVVELDTHDKRTVLRNPKTGKYESDLLVPGTLNPFGKAKKLAESDGLGMVNAPSIRKIGDCYYLVYYASGKNNCHAMCYATSSSPFGPFKYGGILVSIGDARRDGSDKAPAFYTGNVHGGLLNINNTWYIIFHRHTGLGLYGRQACVALLNLREDGGFDHAEHNCQGFSKSALPAYFRWPAYMTCYAADRQGNTKAHKNSPIITQIEYKGGLRDDHSDKDVLQVVSNTMNRSVVGYKYLDFGDERRETMQVCLTMKPVSKGTVEVYADAPISGELLGKIEIPSFSNDWTDYTATIKSLTKVHSIYFVFNSERKFLGDFSYFSFS